MSAILTMRSMTDDVRKLLPTGETLSYGLTAVSNGLAAGDILDAALPKPGTVKLDAAMAEPGDTPLPDYGTIVALPQFATTTFDGANSVNLIQWDTPSVVIVPDGETYALTWEVEDSSRPTITGTIIVTGGEDTSSGENPPVSESISVQLLPFTSRAGARSLLRSLVETGSAEAFQMTHELTGFVHEAVDAASMRVYSEVHNKPSTSRARHVLDPSERETVVDQILYGANNADASVALRLLRRVATSTVTRRKSVVGVIAVNLWSSAAETHVRRAIGDPHVGRLIRRIARQIGSTDPEEVLAAYKKQYPSKAIGLDRIASALSASATIHADAFTLLDNESQA